MISSTNHNKDETTRNQSDDESGSSTTSPNTLSSQTCKVELSLGKHQDESASQVDDESVHDYESDPMSQSLAGNQLKMVPAESLVDLAPSTSTQVLNWNQVKKLNQLLTRTIQIHGRNNMPTLNVTLKDFIRFIHRRLVEQRIRVRDVRINGGVASYILADNHDYQYSDIDIIFLCDLLNLDTNSESETAASSYSSSFKFFSLEASFSNCCDVIKHTILDGLMDHLPEAFNKENLTQQCIKESYVKKMAKIYTQCSTSSNSTSNASTIASSPSSLNASQTIVSKLGNEPATEMVTNHTK
jgi:hypothetical protein